jgi:twitching motility protein PilU
MGFNDLLRMMIEKDGSDLFLTTGAPPSMKAQGKLIPLIDKKLPEGMVKKSPTRLCLMIRSRSLNRARK